MWYWWEGLLCSSGHYWPSHCCLEQTQQCSFWHQLLITCCRSWTIMWWYNKLYSEQAITGSSGTSWGRKGRVCSMQNGVYNYLMTMHTQSSLLQCLLKELPAVSGDVTVRGSVAYASQESWIYSATVRENILFGLPYVPDWYDTVIELCALKRVSICD